MWVQSCFQEQRDSRKFRDEKNSEEWYLWNFNFFLKSSILFGSFLKIEYLQVIILVAEELKILVEGVTSLVVKIGTMLS